VVSLGTEVEVYLKDVAAARLEGPVSDPAGEEGTNTGPLLVTSSRKGRSSRGILAVVVDDRALKTSRILVIWDGRGFDGEACRLLSLSRSSSAKEKAKTRRRNERRLASSGSRVAASHTDEPATPFGRRLFVLFGC